MSSISSDLWPGLALDPETAKALARFARRRRLLMLLRTAAVGIVCFVAMMVAVAICDYLWLLDDGARWLLSLAGYAGTLAAMWYFGLRGFSSGDPRHLARQIESAAPRLREDFLSAVELADPEFANGSEGFRQRLQRNVARRAALLDISRLLPVGLVQRWLVSGSMVTVTCFVMLMIPDMQFGRRIARAMLPGVPIQRASLTELTILKPSPPSGYVAEGDAVGVVVRVGGVAADDVLIEWRADDGIEGESIMSPRVQSTDSHLTGTLPIDNVYAANLSVGTTPIEYRVMAGDAITLWHELTPLPRPRVESFTKRYVFPSYAKLADRIEQAEHGDLRAIVGTLAEVTVRFDESVYDATMRFGNQGVTFNLDAVDGSDREYVVRIPIKTPANYQIDAISARSGLNNPFSPQYSVTPVIDTPPVVSWSRSLSRTLIVSPIDVVSLDASATDDLPMERVVQEFQVNNEPVVRRNVPIDQPSRQLELDWDWDLLHRLNAEESSLKLSGGDIIRARIVGIDRRGQRGESGFIELLIAEEGFDTNRHERLQELSELTSELADWSIRAGELMQQMKDSVLQDEVDLFADARKTVAGLHSERESIASRIQRAVQTSPNLHEASTLELCGRALLDIDQELGAWFAQHEFVSAEQHQAWEQTRQRTLRDLSKQANRNAQSAARIEQYARAIFGEQLTVGIVGDAISLRRSLRPLLNEESPMPADRFPRYLTVAIGRMDEISDLIEQHSEVIPESTRRHLENWMRWPDRWHERLRESVDLSQSSDVQRGLVVNFEAELRKQIDHAMIDGRLASTVINLVREIRNQIGATSDLERQLAAAGDNALKVLARVENEDSSDDVARLIRDAQYANVQLGLWNSLLLDRLEREEELHRSRPNVDLQFAADMNLMHRAVSNVTQSGYVHYRDEPPASVHKNLSEAFRILEAKHEADMWLGELRALMLAERQLEENAIAKIKHPTWLERFSVGLDWPVRSLRNTRIERSLVDRIDRTRYSDDYNKAKQRISSRRWGGEVMLTAELQLDALQQELLDGLLELEPHALEARQTIERYVLTLAEQARQAAEKARQAQARTETRADSSEQTAEQLALEQQEVDDATRETLESLVDLANTAEITDDRQRQLARDADAASAQIQSAADRAQEAIDDASAAASDQDRADSLDQTAKALEDLADSLEMTADHFERAENGEDVSESRMELREAEQAQRLEDELQEQYDRAEALANAVESSPEEMMERLERELQKNEPMQQELSEIAERAAQAAQRTLEKAARDEAALNQSLERSDSVYQERKRRAAHELANLARRAATVDDALLGATERAVGWANAPEIRPKLDEARQNLRDAVKDSNELGGEKALLSEMRETAADMSRSIEAAAAAIEEINTEAEQAQEDNIHRDEASRKKAQDQLQRFAQDARTKQVRAATTEKQGWDRAQRDAGRRVQQAQRQKRDAENRKKQAEQRLKRDPKDAKSLQSQLAVEQQRIDDAQRTEQEAKETQSFADGRGKEVDQRSKQLKGRRIEPLEMANPAAELAVQMTAQATDELDQIERDLKALADETEFADELRVPASNANQLASQQQSIAQDVSDAGEQLRRAARHEQRLGQEQLASQLDAAADAVADNALAAAREAGQSLRQTSDDSGQAPEANRKVGEATEQIGEAARQLAEMLAASSASQSAEALAAQQSEPTAAEQRGQQLAQTLDELDRAMSQPPGEGQQGSGGQPQPGETAGQQGEQPSQQTAGDASPTLAGAMDNQAQQAARRRQQQINPGSPGQQSGQPSDQDAANRNSQTEGGSGQMPSGGFVDTMGISRVGSEWGQLREQRTEDATESRRATIAPEYRREIEAYFRAIARRAAESKE